MAITDVAEYAHLSVADLEALAADLEAIRSDVDDSLGAKDRAYIRRTIAFQRGLEIASRLVIGLGKGKVGWVLGTTALAVAKSIENMELGHNIAHGQWDWMNDPEIHSSTWEWDMVAHRRSGATPTTTATTSSPTLIGMDDDLGFGVMRVSTRPGVEAGLTCGLPLRGRSMAVDRLRVGHRAAQPVLRRAARIRRPTRQIGTTLKACHVPQDGSPGGQGLCSSTRRSADVAFCATFLANRGRQPVSATGGRTS